MTILRRCASILVAGLLLPLFTAGSALAINRDSAPYWYSSIAHGPVALWWCDSTQPFCEQNTVTTGVGNGTNVHMECWDTGRQNAPNSSKWFYVYLQNGQEGFVTESQVANQTTVPACSTINWMNVASYAIARLGTDNNGSSWYDLCLTFASQAWQAGGGVNIAQGYPASISTFPDAIWNWYWGSASLHSFVHNEATGIVSRPPRGALVFWSGGSNPGLWHVAISLGNWQAIGTWDSSVPATPAAERVISMYSVYTGPYTGWIMPPGADLSYNVNNTQT
jgi:hypothetical protein